MDDFLKHWFSGFQSSLNQIDDYSKNQIFRECGKACANSYTKLIYLKAVNNSRNNEEFIEELKKIFQEMEIEVLEPDRLYNITYKYCACDLVKRNYINSPYICECSKNNLLYNWETKFGEGNINVQLVQTILSGAPCCQFQVKVL